MSTRVKRAYITAGAIACGAVLAGAMQYAPASSQRLNGYVTDTWCGVTRDTKPPTVECTRECVHSKRAQYAFFDTDTQKLYIIQQQSKAAPFAGQEVIAEGTIRHSAQKIETMRGERMADTLFVTSIRARK